MQSASKRAEDLKAELDSLQRELEEKQSEVERLQSENEKLKDEKSELGLLAEVLTEEVKRLNGDVGQKSEQIESLQGSKALSAAFDKGAGPTHPSPDQQFLQTFLGANTGKEAVSALLERQGGWRGRSPS